MTDLLIRGARRIGTRGEPSDIRIVSGRIAEIAPADSLAPAAETTEVVEAAGAWIGPGLRDHHTHFDQWALRRRRADVSTSTSAEHAAQILATSGTEAMIDGVLIGHGYRDGLWPLPPRQELLDRIGTGLPVVVVSADLHAVWCSSAAITRFSSKLGRPLAVGADGVLREQDAFDLTGVLSRVPDAIADAAAADAAAAAASRGVTAIVDLEMRFGLDRWQRRVHTGVDSLRVSCGVYPTDLDTVMSRGLHTGDVVNDTHGLVTMGPFKVVTDGSLGTRTAALAQPYTSATDPHDRGVLTWPPDILLPIVRRAVHAGLVPAIHAIGDRANTLALDVFESIGATGTIEHAQLLDDADLSRFARLGVTASVQPEHAMDDRDLADRYWADRADRSFPYGALERAGARILLGSDAPVAPLDPWIAMAAAVGRARDGRDVWHPSQRMSVLGAWRATTGGPVSISTGARADLVLTSDDPLHTPADGLRTMRVLGTLLDGRFTYRDF